MPVQMTQLLLSFLLTLTCFAPVLGSAQDLFTPTPLKSRWLPTHKAQDAIGLELDAAAFAALRSRSPERATLVLPFAQRELALKLEQFDVRSDVFEVGVTDESGFRSVVVEPRIQTYEVRGEAEGTLILFHDHVVASLTVEGRRWEINRRHELVHALFPVDASTDDRIFSCGVDDFAALPHHGHNRGPASARASNLLECVEVGIEVDQYSHNALGSNLDNTVDWALAILASVDQIYRNELNDLVTLDARFLHVWASPDPYVSVVNDGGGILGAFNNEWNNNPNFNAIPLDLKHFFTIRTNIGTGGIAYLSGLCNGFNAGVSGNLTTTTNYNVNTYAWNLDVVAHEMGHNCGANHTHWCGWPGGPIDNCGSYEGDCTGYTDNPTGQLGTIMSYCHAIAGGSKTLTFHPLVEDNALIPTFNSASCIGTCGDNVVTSTDLQCGDAGACNYTPGDTNNDGCIYAGECAECGPDGNIIGGLDVPAFDLSLAGGVQNEQSFDAVGTPQAVSITLTFDNAQSSGSWPGDMALILCSPGGECLQIGGYDIDPGYPSAGGWPGGWNVSTPGTYTANIGLNALSTFGDGTWTLAILNGWTSSGTVDYGVTLQFPGLCPLESGICGAAACGSGTWWDDAAGLCRSLQVLCPGDVDGDGDVTVSDILNVLGSFGTACDPSETPSECASAPCCDSSACGTGTVWNENLGQCVRDFETCVGDLDFDGAVGVIDVLLALSDFGLNCE